MPTGGRLFRQSDKRYGMHNGRPWAQARERGRDVAESETPRGTLGTVRNAAQLLDLLSTGPAFHQLTDLAERSGLSLPTVHRLLRSLVAAGLVEQDPRSSRYGLGPELVRLSERYLERVPLLQTLAPYLVDLRNRTRASVLVALLVRDTVVYVDRIEGAGTGDTIRRSDRSAPAHRTAAGRLLLARRGPEAYAPLLGEPGLPAEAQWRSWADGQYVIADVDGLHEHVEVAVGVPGPDGTTLAALVATGGPPALTRETLERDVVPQLTQTAALVARVAAHA